MKVMITLAALVAIGWLIVFYFGGYNSFDASEQGRRAKASIGPGMSHTQVFDVCGDPRSVRKIRRQVKKIGGQSIETFVPGPEVNTSREQVGERVQAGAFPHGFVIPYRFSDSVAFAVYFDSSGTVETVEDLTTMADLLQYED